MAFSIRNLSKCNSHLLLSGTGRVSQSHTNMQISTKLTVSLPLLLSEQKSKLFRVPKNGEDLRGMSEVIAFYAKDNYWKVCFAYISIYLNFQSFAVPGAAVLAMLSGPIFGAIPAFMISHICAVIGACVCF